MKKFYILFIIFFIALFDNSFAQTGASSDSVVCITIRGNNTDGKFQQAHISNLNPTAADISQPEIDAAAWTCNAQGVPACNFRSVFRFDLSQIPENVTVTHAKLTLYAKPNNINGYVGSPTYGSNNEGVLQMVTSPWSLSSVSWNNQPQTTAIGQVTLPQSTSTVQNYELNITNMVSSWVNYPSSNYGALIRLKTENYYNSLIFHSGSSADSVQPKLEICYIKHRSGPPTGTDTTCAGGIPLFVKEYKLTGNQYIYGVRSMPDGGDVSVGYISGSGNGGYDGLVVKTDHKGVVEWSKAIGGAGDDYFYQVRSTSDGGMIIAGQTKSYGNTAGDGWLVKLDAAGNVEWSKKYGDGNVNGEILYDVIELSGGGYAFCGTHKFAPGTAEGFVGKVDSSGNVLWARQYGNFSSDELSGIVEDGNSLVTAGFYYGASYFDGYVMSLDKATGDVQWMKGYDAENRSTRLVKIEKIATGYQVNCIVTNDWIDTDQQQCVLNIGTDGSFQSIRKVVVPGTRTSSAGWYPLADGGFIASDGSSTSSTDALLCRVNSDGSIRWAKKFGGTGSQILTALTSSSDGGYTGSGITNVTGTVADSNNVYIVRVDSLGEGGSCTSENTLDISVVTPSYSLPVPDVVQKGNVTINNPVITTGSVDLNLAANTLCFACIKKPTGTSRTMVSNGREGHRVKAYPNPVVGRTINLEINAAYNDFAVITIVDIYGNIVYVSGSKEIQKGINTITLNMPFRLQPLTNYFIHVRFTDSVNTIKVFVLNQ